MPEEQQQGPTLRDYYELRERVVELESRIETACIELKKDIEQLQKISSDNQGVVRKIGWAVALAVLSALMKVVKGDPW